MKISLVGWWRNFVEWCPGLWWCTSCGVAHIDKWWRR